MNENCTIYKVSQIIGKKWMLLILIELEKGEDEWKRFSKLKSKLCMITSKVLSERLKQLIKEDMIGHRVDKSLVPMVSEYRLTKSGHAFMKVMKEMKKWALEYKIKSRHCSSIDCKCCHE